MVNLIEKLAKVEHDQWIHWSQAIAQELGHNHPIVKRWVRFWVPYEELPETSKDIDRSFARVALFTVIEHLKLENKECEKQ